MAVIRYKLIFIVQFFICLHQSLAMQSSHLIAAINNRKSKEAVALIDSDSKKINVPDNLGRTPVYLATEQGMEVVVTKLVEKRADVNTFPPAGYPPIYLAALNDKEDILRTLIDAGADATKETMHGWTAFCIAALKGNKKALRVLYEKSIRTCGHSDHYNSPLFLQIQEEMKNKDLGKGLQKYRLVKEEGKSAL